MLESLKSQDLAIELLNHFNRAINSIKNNPSAQIQLLEIGIERIAGLDPINRLKIPKFNILVEKEPIEDWNVLQSLKICQNILIDPKANNQHIKGIFLADIFV